MAENRPTLASPSEARAVSRHIIRTPEIFVSRYMDLEVMVPNLSSLIENRECSRIFLG